MKGPPEKEITEGEKAAEAVQNPVVLFTSKSESVKKSENKEVEGSTTTCNKKIIFLILGVIFICIAALVIGLVLGLRLDGDLIKVTTEISQIGINLDDFPQELRESLILKMTSMPETYWINRVNKQISLTSSRMAFRSTFYTGTKQLMIPESNFLKINFLTAPTLSIVDGHYVITRNYTMETYILGKKDSAKISDPKLEYTGGVVWENYTFPIDPTLIFQNTDYACMNEISFPKGSVDPESVETYFDDSCLAAKVPVNITMCVAEQIGCHCTKDVNLTCVEAITQKIGSTSMNFKYEKIAFNYTLADQIEALNPLKPNPDAKGADLKGLIEGLENNSIQYKYFDCLKSCCVNECLQGKCGWRRLLMFDTTGVNWGTETLEQERNMIYDDKAENFDAKKYHYLYYYDACHKHPHFYGYASYSYGSLPGYKMGFCSQDVYRKINHRAYNIWGEYDTCYTQGVSPGWADKYNVGIPCQWLDVTDVTSNDRNSNLTVTTNHNKWMCEGTKNKYENGTTIMVPTGNFTTSPPFSKVGETIYAHSCNLSPGALDNNVESTRVAIPDKGEGGLTNKCKYPMYTIGPKRNCEFALIKNYESCNPGNKSVLTCTNMGDNIIVVRLCESSIQLQSGTACRYNDEHMMGNYIISPKNSKDLEFQCSSPRDSPEIGGKFSIYAGNIFNEGLVKISDFSSLSCIIKN